MIESPPSARGDGGLGRTLRYLIRVPLLLVHLIVFLPLVLMSMVPLWSGLPWQGERLEHRVIRLWSGRLLRIFGLRVRSSGHALPDPVLFVANHVSWMDIEMLHSQRMVGFVAKREIRAWPLVGWLALRGETIFHQRGSQESTGGVMHAMLERLRQGGSVAVFPEGRTRDGHALGPFHARLLQPAVEAGVPVQPVALCYGTGSEAQAIIAFGPGENFLVNFLRLLGEPPRQARVHFLEPFSQHPSGGRKQMADLARERIVAAMARI